MYLKIIKFLGYKVVTGRLEKTRKQLSYIIGAPRGNQMKGMVSYFIYLFFYVFCQKSIEFGHLEDEGNLHIRAFRTAINNW